MQLKLSDLLDESLILFNVEAKNREELLTKLSHLLYERGYVKESYLVAVQERENKYPTGLPTKMIRIAVPHTGIEHVKKSGILVAFLKEPIVFKDMGNGVDDIPVELVFMLSISAPKDQLLVLQQIIDLFSNDKALTAIKAVRDAKSFIQVIKDNIQDQVS